MSSRGRRKGRRPSSSSSGAIGDGFFESDRKRRRKSGGGGGNEFIESDDDDSDGAGVSADGGGDEAGEDDAAAVETAAEKRLRVAREHLEKIRAITMREREERYVEREGGERDEDEEDDDGGEREGRRDSLVADYLQKEQLEDSGRVKRSLAAKVLKPESCDEFRMIQRHRQSVTAVALAEDDARGFSASKDGVILHWDVESGKREKYLWPSEDVLISHGTRAMQNRSSKRSNHVLALAVSSDGRYLATGGLDRHVHLWDTRTREHVQAFPGHKGPVSCLAFRQGTSQLFSASFDRIIKLWNAEDRCHMDNLYGHQSDILTIDCLRKERLLTVGRDRTMRLWKVPEESQLVFRAPASSLECCCFINNEEFLSGSDDGSIELWGIQRKKPTHIVKNAHSISAASLTKDSEMISNGINTDDAYCNGVNNTECEGRSCSSVQSWVSSVTVCRGSDLAASGAGNGVVHLWATESETKSIRPLYDLPLVGFVNSLAFARSGRFLVAGVGQEPRLGRWGRISAATNGVALYSLRLSEKGVNKQR